MSVERSANSRCTSPRTYDWARQFLIDLAADCCPELYSLEDFTDEEHKALSQIVDEGFASRRAALREATVFIVGELRFISDSLVERIAECFDDDSEQVRCACAWAAGKLPAHAKLLIPKLIAALDDPGETVRFGALYALGQLGPCASDAVPKLLEHSQSPKDIHRSAAVRALANTAPAKKLVQQRLCVALRDTDAGTRAVATLGLGYSGSQNSRIVGRVADMLHDPRTMLFALDALARLKPQNGCAATELLRAMSREEWYYVSPLPGEPNVRLRIREDFDGAMRAVLEPLADEQLDDFRMRLFSDAFHPAPTDDVAWIDLIVNHPWYKRMQRARFPHPASHGERLRLHHWLAEAKCQFAQRLWNTPTLGMTPQRYRELPGYVKKHCLKIASRIMRAAESSPVPIEIEVPSAVETPLVEAARRDEAEILKELIATHLKPLEATVITCRYEKCWSISETAIALGLTESKVRTLEHRALLRLRWELRLLK